VNEKGVDHADGDGYYIRNGIIVVPKDGTIRPGTMCLIRGAAARLHRYRLVMSRR
jgi:hypothetical protein